MLPDHVNYREVSFCDSFEKLPSESETLSGVVLLLHGLTGTPAEMETLASSLSDRNFATIAPCLMGHHGDLRELKSTRAYEWRAQCETSLGRALEISDQAPVSVVGLSFGGLLALLLACFHPGKVRAVVALSPPLRLRSTLNDRLFRGLSRLPDAVLDLLPVRSKKVRPAGYLEEKHHAYPVHSLGAVARMFQLRQTLDDNLTELGAPLFVGYDPDDHHIDAASLEKLGDRVVCSEFSCLRYPGGQHELTLGPRRADLFRDLRQFLIKYSGS